MIIYILSVKEAKTAWKKVSMTREMPQSHTTDQFTAS